MGVVQKVARELTEKRTLQELVKLRSDGKTMRVACVYAGRTLTLRLQR